MANLLLVEDDAGVRGVLAKMLEGGGHEVTAATGGAEALKLLDGAGFDLVIADILMPDVDGVQLLRELRKRKSPVKVIAISGGGRAAASDYLEMAALLGAAATLMKPIDAPTLLKAVAKVLGTK